MINRNVWIYTDEESQIVINALKVFGDSVEVSQSILKDNFREKESVWEHFQRLKAAAETMQKDFERANKGVQGRVIDFYKTDISGLCCDLLEMVTEGLTQAQSIQKDGKDSFAIDSLISTMTASNPETLYTQMINNMNTIFRHIRRKNVNEFKWLIDNLQLLWGEFFKDEKDFTYITGIPESRAYRSKKTREGLDLQRDFPQTLATPSKTDFKNALTPNPEGKAFLKSFDNVNLSYKDGILTIEGLTGKDLSIYLQDDTNKGVTQINTPLLTALYSIYYKAFEDMKQVPQSISFVVSDFFRIFKGTKHGKNGVQALIKNMREFNKIVGVLDEGYSVPSYYQVLNFEEYDSTTNVITFTATYFKHLIENITNATATEQGAIATRDENGQMKIAPIHSHSIKPQVISEKDITAFDIMRELVVLIEGSRTPNIKPKTIIERVPVLSNLLENDRPHATMKFKRHFSKAFEMLTTQTTLLDKFPELAVSFDKNMKNSIKLKNLDTKSEEFKKLLPNLKNIENLTYFFQKKDNEKK